ncbi:MAG: acriflavin resistance protein [Ruminococcaceae bacterium]|nr:acriflavin resistance protein [Oscillospiraceae bacterium]
MTKLSVKKPFTVLVAVVLVFVLGIVSFTRLNTDLLPKMDLPYVIAMTTAPGASPERVETTVTQPLESALATTSGLENMQSISMENASIIIMEFSQSVNMDSAMIEMSSSIDMVEGYFEDTVSTPMLMKLNPDLLPVQVLSVDMDGMDIKQLSAYIENELSPYLERIDGVATVDVTGLVKDYVSIQLNQEKIDKINDEILKAVDKNLYKVKKEIDDGKAELAKGRAELEKQRDDAYAKLADVSYQLDTANAQLQSMLSQTSQLEAKKAVLDNDQMKTAFAGLDGLRAAPAGIDSLIAGINAQLPPAMPPFGDTTPVGTLTATLDMAVQNPMLPAEEKAAMEKMNTMLKGYEAAKTVAEVKSDLAAQATAIETQLAASGISMDIVKGGSAALTQAIAEYDGQIAQSKLMAQGMQSMVDELKKGYLEAEKAQMAAVTGFSAGTAQIDAFEKEIEAGLEEFESARDEALRSANIDSLVTQSTISGILTAQNFSMPAGYIMLGDERVTVKVGEKFDDLESLKNLLLVDMGLDGVEPVYLKDVATVEIKDNSGDSFVKINGNDGIVLSVSKSSVASTSQVSEAVSEAINKLEQKTEGLHIATLMDQGDYINMVVQSVLSNLVYGGIIALLVLVLFLKSFRPTAIIAMSIPLSVLVAIVAMYFTDVTLNMISLSGLALAVGMLVDNSIVVIENIYRLRNEGYSAVKAAVVGTRQVGGAIIASTLTTICVFVPIVFTQGLTRQIFTDMGLTIAYVLVASLLVALTFVPCLASNMLGKSTDASPKFITKLTKLYEKALRVNLKHKWVALVLAVALLVLSVYNALTMPMAFIPAMDGPQMTMTLTVDGTTSDDDLYAQGWDIAQRVQKLQDVDTVAVMSEGESVASMTSSTDNSKSLSFYVVLTEDRTLSNSELGALIESELPEYADTLNVITESIDMSALGGSGFSVAIKGNDFDTLGKISADLAGILKGIDGVASVDDGSGRRSNEMRIEIDKTAAMKEGLMTAQIYQSVAAALTEQTTTTTFTFDGKDLSGYITSDAPYTRDTIESLELATKINDDGEEESVTLGDVATITTAQSPQTISRDNQSRTYTVSAAFENGVNSTLVSREAQAAVEAYELPDGYQLDVGGENQMVMEMMGDMALMILLAVVFIYLIMVAQFQSLKSPFIVLLTIPMAFTGGLLALQLTGTVLSVVSMIGFLVLAGVVVNNGIVFIDYVNQLRAEGMEMYDALVKTGVDRMRPILMTALTTILAMSTMAFGVGMGAEMSQGMAIVSIGGLSYATLLTLFLVPSLYAMLHKKPLRVIEVDFEEE